MVPPMGKDFLVELESNYYLSKSLHDDLIDSLLYIAAIASPPVGTFGTVNTATTYRWGVQCNIG